LPPREDRDRCLEHCDERYFSAFIDDGEDIPHVAGMQCYTDGSGRNRTHGSGLAVYAGGSEQIHTSAEKVREATGNRVSGGTTCYYDQTQPNQQQVVILSDSQAAIKAVSKRVKLSCTVFTTVTALNDWQNY
jgi:ribonuclease HI